MVNTIYSDDVVQDLLSMQKGPVWVTGVKTKDHKVYVAGKVYHACNGTEFGAVWCCFVDGVYKAEYAPSMIFKKLYIYRGHWTDTLDTYYVGEGNLVMVNVPDDSGLTGVKIIDERFLVVGFKVNTEFAGTVMGNISLGRSFCHRVSGHNVMYPEYLAATVNDWVVWNPQSRAFSRVGGTQTERIDFMAKFGETVQLSTKVNLVPVDIKDGKWRVDIPSLTTDERILVTSDDVIQVTEEVAYIDNVEAERAVIEAELCRQFGDAEELTALAHLVLSVRDGLPEQVDDLFDEEESTLTRALKYLLKLVNE